MSSMNLPFIGRTLAVTTSPDPTLVGLSGTVVGESRRTLTLDGGGEPKMLAKNVLGVTLARQAEEIQGAMVTQRPEDRIHRNYRRN